MGSSSSREQDAEIETGGVEWVRQSEPSPDFEEDYVASRPWLPQTLQNSLSEADPDADIVRLILHKDMGAVLGADFANAAGNSGGAVITHVARQGLIRDWNEANPAKALAPGHIVTEVNGARGYFQVVEQLGKSGALELIVMRCALKEGWHSEMSRFGEALRRQGDGALWLRLETPQGRLPRDPSRFQAAARSFTSFHTARAADAGASTCCICLEDIDPDERVVQLPCNHGYHSVCMSLWLTKNQRRTCPLCASPVGPLQGDAPERGLAATVPRPAHFQRTRPLR